MQFSSLKSVAAILLLAAVGACGESVVEVNSSPSLTVMAPLEGSVIVGGVDVALEATATDAEDGSLAGSVSWTSDVDGSLGSGGSLLVELSIGEHVIRATVSDSEGATDSASVSIEVVPEPEQVTDLRVESVDDSTVALTWTEVSDGLGEAAVYEVEFGASPVNTEAANSATEGSCSDAVGVSVGAELTCQVTGLRSGTTYGFLVTTTRSLSNGETAEAPASDVATTTTDFYEDFSRFQAGDVPEAPHEGFSYVTNDGTNTLTVQVVTVAGPLGDFPLSLSKGDQAVVGAPNFSITSNSDFGLLYAPGGVLTITFDLVPMTGDACQLVGVRPGSGPSAWISVFGDGGSSGDFVTGQLYTLSLILDLDAETISATRDGAPFEMSRWSDDNSTVLKGNTLDYPYHPRQFDFGGCTTADQSVAVDNISMTLRRE